MTNRVGNQGSFMIAAICRDGIVVVAESRANIFDNADINRTPIAYYDTCQKVFPIGAGALAETGQGLILGTFFSAIVDDFVAAVAHQPPAERLLPEFVRFCEGRYPPAAVVQIRKQILLAAGYRGEHPTICYFNDGQQPEPFGCIQDHGFIESAPTSFGAHAAALSAMSCDEVGELASRAITEYANEGERWKTMGGPVDILRVTRAGCQWLRKATPTQKWKRVQDFVESYRRNEIAVTFIHPATEETLRALLATVPEGGNRTT